MNFHSLKKEMLMIRIEARFELTVSASEVIRIVLTYIVKGLLWLLLLKLSPMLMTNFFESVGLC